MRRPHLIISTVLSLFAALLSTCYAQNGLPFNMYADTAFYPFIYGVASGDPLQDRVILWTKVVTEEKSTAPVVLQWQIATDSLFAYKVNQGTAVCEAGNHYCTQTDATGLQQGQRYYYRFISMELLNYAKLNAV